MPAAGVDQGRVEGAGVGGGRARRIQIRWRPHDLTVVAELDEHRNAALADALWDALPYRSLQGHALVAGHHLYHVAPVHDLLHLRAAHRIDRRTVPDGTVFCSQLQHLGIKYGALTEPMNAAPIGRVVDDDLEVLAAAGQAVWHSVYRNGPPVLVEVCRLGEEGGHAVRRLPTRSAAAGELVARIHRETERAWLVPPDELSELHAGRIRSRAGSFATVLPTLLFVNGETRPLGYAAYGGLVRAARNAELGVEALREMARQLVMIPAEFLGYCGLTRLWELTQAVSAALPELEREDFVAVMSHMALYVNCLGGWNLQLFPWSLGDHLRQEEAAL